MATDRHDSSVLSWGQLLVDLPFHDTRTWEDFQQLVQLTWLLLLSTYDGIAQPSCYFHTSGDSAFLHLLSLAIDRSLTLIDHAGLIRTDSVSTIAPENTQKTAICHGPMCEFHAWIAQYDRNAINGTLEIALVLDDITKTSHSTYDPTTRYSLTLLYDNSQAKIQEEDAIAV